MAGLHLHADIVADTVFDSTDMRYALNHDAEAIAGARLLVTGLQCCLE